MKTAVTLEDAKGLTEEDIFDLEAAYVDMVSSKKRDNRQGYFHPSSVGGCGRRNVYEYIRTPFIDTLEPESQEIFDIGHAVHDLVGKKLADVGKFLQAKNLGYELRLEVPFDPTVDQLFVDFGIGGTCDGQLKIWADSWRQRSTLETKSIGDKGFEQLNGPKPDHLEQAHIYAYRFDTPIIYLWYYNKNNSKRKVYRVPYDHDILLGALKKYESWMQHVSAGTLPDRQESWFDCPRCEYRNECQPSVVRNKANRGHNKKLSVIRDHGKLR